MTRGGVRRGVRPPACRSCELVDADAEIASPTSRRSPRSPTCGSPTSPWGSASSRSGMGGEWDATNLVAGRRGRAHADRARPSRSSATPSAEVATEKAGIIKDGRHRGEPGAGRRRARRDRGPLPRGRRRAAAGVPRLGGGGAAPGGGRAGPAGPGAVRDLRRAVPAAVRRARRAQRRAPPSWRSRRSSGEALDDGAAPARRWRPCGGPGGMEVVARHPSIMLDGAHNPAGAEALSDSAPRGLHLGTSCIW